MSTDLELCFRRLHASNILGIVTADGERITSANGAFLRMLGYTRADVRAGRLQWRKLTPPEFAAIDKKNFREVVRRGRCTPFEKEYFRKDGSRVPVLLGAARLARAPFTCVCFVQDLSERKRSEAALRANQKQWEVLVQTAPAAIVIHGADGKLLRCNSVAERLLGLSQPRAAGKTLNARAWHFLREDGTPMPVEEYPVALVLKQKTPLSNYICGIRHAGKKTVWVLVNAQPRFGGDGALADVTVAFIDITERKRAEREREEFFKFFAISSDIMVIADPNGAFKKVNPAALTLLGYSEKELISKPFVDFVHPEDRQATLDEMARQIKTGVSINFENRYVCRNGEVRWLSWRAAYDPGDGITYATARDITESKRVEEALRESETRFRQLADMAPLGVWVRNLQGKSEYVSRWFLDYLGMPGPLHLDAGRGQVIHPEDLPRVQAAWKKASAAGSLYQREVRLRDRHGQYRWFLSRAVPLKDERGRPQRWLGTYTDIHDQKLAEQVFAEREARFRLLVESIPVPAWTAEPGGGGGFCNRRWCEYTGQTAEQFTGDGWLQAVHPEDLAPTRRQILLAIRRRRLFQAEYRLRRHDGIYRWHLARAHAARSESGKITGWFGTTTDIHDQKMAQAELERRVAERTAALRENQATLQSFYDSAPFLMGVAELDGDRIIVVSGNRAVADFLQTTPAGLAGKRGSELGTPRYIEQLWVENYRRSQRLGAPVRFEYEHPRAGQTLCWLRATVAWIGSGSVGRPQFSFVAEDITSRKQIEDALIRSEERFRVVVQDQTELICRFRADGTLLFANEVLCRFFGKKSGELIGRRWHPHALAEDVPRIEFALGQLTKKNPVVVVENRVYDGKGEVRWMQFVNRGFFDRQGRLLETQAVGRDITERKQAEMALRESEEKFRRLFGTVADAVLLVDTPTRRISEVNDAMLRMYGCSRQEALRLTITELSAQPEAAGEALQRAAAGLSEPNLRALHRKRDGMVFPVQISAGTFEFQGRQLVCLVVRDITREVEMEKEILAISERERQRIARDVHDDLCQHLTGIQFLASTLAADLKDLARPESAGARRIAGLTRQALQKARGLSHGLAPVELEHGGLAVALRRLSLQVRSMFRCQCHFRCDSQVALPPPATAIHLYRIVQEAVSNAVRHGRASRIEISIIARPRGWVLKIADNGHGIANRKNNGTTEPGLGLRVMKYRAGIIGATLAVRPRPRAGTEVICTLPDGAMPLASESLNEKNKSNRR